MIGVNTLDLYVNRLGFVLTLPWICTHIALDLYAYHIAIYYFIKVISYGKALKVVKSSKKTVTDNSKSKPQTR